MGSSNRNEYASGVFFCPNQQSPQRGSAIPDPVWVELKRLLAFRKLPVTPGTPLKSSSANWSPILLPLEKTFVYFVNLELI